MMIKRLVTVVGLAVSCVPMVVHAATVPTGVSVQDVTDSTAYVTWSGDSEDTEYAVYLDGVPVETVTGTMAQLTGLEPDSTHVVAVTGLDSQGQESGQSDSVSFTTSQGWQGFVAYIASYLLLACCAGAVAGYLRLVMSSGRG